MAEPVIVRRLGRADVEAYKALRDAMLEAHPDAFTSDAPTERRKAATAYLGRLGLDRPEGGHFTLGAFQGEALVGAISCERDERVKVRHIGHVVGMMVCPPARGAGVARMLLDHCLALVRETDGMELLTLSVTAGNAAAERLYESAGFRTYGTLARAIKLGDTALDKTLMSLAL
jgi:ribosomal protein S18 acetylase RimI-like enzyme